MFVIVVVCLLVFGVCVRTAFVWMHVVSLSVCAGFYPLDRWCDVAWPVHASREMGAIGMVCIQCLVAGPLTVARTHREVA